MPDDLPQTAASGLNSRWPESLRALRHRNYQLFFAGQLISLIGTWGWTRWPGHGWFIVSPVPLYYWGQ